MNGRAAAAADAALLFARTTLRKALACDDAEGAASSATVSIIATMATADFARPSTHASVSSAEIEISDSNVQTPSRSHSLPQTLHVPREPAALLGALIQRKILIKIFLQRT